MGMPRSEVYLIVGGKNRRRDVITPEMKAFLKAGNN